MTRRRQQQPAPVHLLARLSRDGLLQVACGADLDERHCTRHIDAVTCVDCRTIHERAELATRQGPTNESSA